MVQVKVGNNMERKTVIVESTQTLRQVLEENEIDYTRGVTTLDGSTLSPGDLDKTFEQHGITDHCFLYSVAKLDNA